MRRSKSSAFLDPADHKHVSRALTCSFPAAGNEHGQPVLFDLTPEAVLEAGGFRETRWAVTPLSGEQPVIRRVRYPVFFLFPGRYAVTFYGRSHKGGIFRASMQLSVKKSSSPKDRPMPHETPCERLAHQTQFNTDLFQKEGVRVKTRAIRGVDSRGAFKQKYSDKYQRPLTKGATVRMLLARLAEVIDFSKVKVDVVDQNETVIHPSCLIGNVRD